MRYRVVRISMCPGIWARIKSGADVLANKNDHT